MTTSGRDFINRFVPYWSQHRIASSLSCMLASERIAFWLLGESFFFFTIFTQTNGTWVMGSWITNFFAIGSAHTAHRGR